MPFQLSRAKISGNSPEANADGCFRPGADTRSITVVLACQAMDFTAARTHFMNNSTTGLKVRFFSVNKATGRV